ncbi:hypothetical protein Q9189_002446 [Teloschistes chrysophthalmus]
MDGELLPWVTLYLARGLDHRKTLVDITHGGVCKAWVLTKAPVNHNIDVLCIFTTPGARWSSFKSDPPAGSASKSPPLSPTTVSPSPQSPVYTNLSPNQGKQSHPIPYSFSSNHTEQNPFTPPYHPNQVLHKSKQTSHHPFPPPSPNQSTPLQKPLLTTLTTRPSTIASAPATTVPESASHKILTAQRLNRPVSPHLTIYQPQIPWILSALNRITGSLLSGGFYLFGFAYLIAPYLGLHLESSALAEAFGGMPGWARGGCKFLLAVPFVFHSVNGVRHLVWDSGRQFGNKRVVRSGWVVVGATVVGSVGLAVWGT